jgi:starch phosphorylase
MSEAVQSHPEAKNRCARRSTTNCSAGGCRPRASKADLYQALAHVAREQLAKRWVDTQNADRENKARRVYYLSMEFLIGRAMNNALSALDLRDQAATVFTPPGPSLTR